MKYEIVTEDGETVLFDCGSDEDVITAGLRQDVILMSSCREGGCATCKSLCADGDYELRNCSVQALPPEEEEEGLVLLCRTFPRSDLVLEVPYTSDRIAHGSCATRVPGRSGGPGTRCRRTRCS